MNDIISIITNQLHELETMYNTLCLDYEALELERDELREIVNNTIRDLKRNQQHNNRKYRQQLVVFFLFKGIPLGCVSLLMGGS